MMANANSPSWNLTSKRKMWFPRGTRALYGKLTWLAGKSWNIHHELNEDVSSIGKGGWIHCHYFSFTGVPTVPLPFFSSNKTTSTRKKHQQLPSVFGATNQLILCRGHVGRKGSNTYSHLTKRRGGHLAGRTPLQVLASCCCFFV